MGGGGAAGWVAQRLTMLRFEFYVAKCFWFQVPIAMLRMLLTLFTAVTESGDF